MRFRLKTSLLLVAVVWGATAHAQNIPPVPANGSFVQDYAGILRPDAVADISAHQRGAWEKQETPLIVVTIRTMADYGGRGMDIEEFATRWFNQWQIGKKRPDGTLVNRGIMLLVSVGDRRARIELGADWGRGWDGYARRVMDDAIVPRFRSGDFSGGIAAGVRELAAMAEAGPGARQPAATPAAGPAPAGASPFSQVVQGAAPAVPPSEMARGAAPRVDDRVAGLSPLPRKIVWLMVIGGIVLIVAAFLYPEMRKPLLIAGAGLVIVGLFTWVIVAVLAMFAGAKSRSGSGGFSSGGGGFSSGGGGFSSGGFSGGGGASGSW